MIELSYSSNTYSGRHFSFTKIGMALLLILLHSLANAHLLPDFTALVEKTAPAVVNISTVNETTTERNNPFLQFDKSNPDIPEIFRHFFGDLSPFQQRQPKEAPSSLGSGFIISADGYVLTNHHVIKNASKIIVRLSDKREFIANLIGTDERSDLALLQIQGDNLPTVTMGNSDNLKTGEWVLAIGSPFGFDYSVTAGIISAIGRNLESEDYVPFIQTDVAINPGNSGGPLFNMDGEVIGINSQIYTRSGGFMGLSFAIPMNMAKKVADQLRDDGYVSRGWLGVTIQEVNTELAESFGLDKPRGALITQVLAHSPALVAGLKPGDIITHFDSQEIKVSADLPSMVGDAAPDSEVQLDIIRNGKKQSTVVTIGLLPDDPQVAQSPPDRNIFGLSVTELDAQQKQRWQVQDGVVVKDIAPDGVAARAGLHVGDIITSVNGVETPTARIFYQSVKNLPRGRSIALRLIRQGKPLFIPFKVTD